MRLLRHVSNPITNEESNTFPLKQITNEDYLKSETFNPIETEYYPRQNYNDSAYKYMIPPMNLNTNVKE